MIVPILHLLKIHREMILGNPAVVVQDMLGIAPESLNAVDVVAVLVGEGFGVVEPVMLAEALEGIVAPKGIRVVDRSFPCTTLDMPHEFCRVFPLVALGVRPAGPLQ